MNESVTKVTPDLLNMSPSITLNVSRVVNAKIKAINIDPILNANHPTDPTPTPDPFLILQTKEIGENIYVCIR